MQIMMEEDRTTSAPAHARRARRAWPSGEGWVLGLLLTGGLLLAGVQSEAWEAGLPTAGRWTTAGVGLLLWAGLCAALQRRRQATSTSDTPHASPDTTDNAVVLIDASQTGTAAALADQHAQLLHNAGIPTRRMPLGACTPAQLAHTRRALFFVSTAGEGDCPDSALPFLLHMQAAGGKPPALQGLRYGLLALGDRAYPQFCGFGRTLDRWLQSAGAEPACARVEMATQQEAAWRYWLESSQALHDPTEIPDHATGSLPNGWSDWRILHREAVNHGSPGAPCHTVRLQPADPAEPFFWQPGDLLEVRSGPHQEPRAYSIASLPTSGYVELLVRQPEAQGQPVGEIAPLLTGRTPQVTEQVAARLRAHPVLRLPQTSQPLILIGNGTGIAGLMALIRARLQQPTPTENWLIHGERTLAFDNPWGTELEAARDAPGPIGRLTRLDRIRSRDTPTHPYVQDHLRLHAQDLRAWVSRGAAVFVCGSRSTMAPAVHEALTELLGADTLAALAGAGRYRRDVY